MNDDKNQRAKLEADTNPVAIVQYGIFAYANDAFLELLGIPDRAELLAIPLLDLVSKNNHEALKSHLAQGARIKETAENLPETTVTLVSQKGDYFEAVLRSHKIDYEGEESVKISVQKPFEKTLWNSIKRIPWTLYLAVAFLILFSTAPGILLQRLGINNAPQVYFPADEPAVVIDNEVREIFPNDQVVVMMFEGVALFSDGFLEAFDELAYRLTEHPQIDDVMSVTTQDHISGTEDGFVVEPLIDIELLDDSHPRDRPEFTAADRFARSALVAADGSALSMIVIPFEADNSIIRLNLLNDIQKEIEDLRLDGYLTAMAGDVPADVAQLRAMLRNNMIFIPVTTTIGLLMIWWLFHRLLAVVIGGICMGVVTTTTITLYVIFDRPFTLLSSMIPPLLSALTIATLVHLFNGIAYSAQRGLYGKRRIQATLDEIRSPARFSAFTTSAGLASLALSPIPSIADFGLISAAGIVLIYVSVIWAVPQVFARWDNAEWSVRRGGLKWMDAFVKKLARIGIRNPVAVILVTLVLIGAGAPQIMNIRVETSLLEFFQPDHFFRASTERVDERLVGTTPIDVIFEVPERDGLLNPVYLNQMKQFQEWALEREDVDKAISPVDFIEEMHWGFHEEMPEYRTIPDEQDLITQYLFIYDGEDLGDFLDEEYSTARMSLNLNVHKAKEINAAMDAMRDYLGQNISGEMTYKIAGSGRLFADMENLLVQGQIYSLSGALVLIFVLMLLLWRSLFQAILSMVPNLSPILLIFIFMGLFDIWLDMATALIASVAVGIAVDDTIHVMHGFKERLDKGYHPVLALMRTYSQAGRAVVTTTIILSTQFLALVISEFNPFNKFGLLTAIGLNAALLFDLLVLPAILILIYGRRNQSKPAEVDAVEST